MQSIPCKLHCANRVNLKILTVLLCEGLSNAKRGNVLSQFPSEGRRIDEFLLGIKRIVNTSILGKVEHLSQLRVPTNLPTSKLTTEIASHMSDYLYKWHNLYKHSQQGWESLNNLITSFWFHRTGRGGATIRA
eukprot:scaffold52668_cov71-Attheya_sp.AAC.2